MKKLNEQGNELEFKLKWIQRMARRRNLREQEMDVDDVDPETLIDPQLREDAGSNPTGLYELTGVLTHAGSNADSGHWQGWTKQAEGGTVH